MPDTTPTPAAADANKPRKPRGPIDSHLLDQLGSDEDIIAAVIAEMTSDAALAKALGAHFIDRDNTIPATLANVQALLAQAGAARATAGAAIAGTADFHDVTAAEGADAATAIAAIRNVQARAKEKYEESNPAQLAAYFVGQPLKSRAQITLAGTGAYQLVRTTDDNGNPVTPQDTLPGYDQAKIDQFKTDLGGFYSVQTDQSGAQASATGQRTDFKAECEQVSRRRRKLQLAIDAERPHGPANQALRARLKMPTDKGMS